MAKPRNKVLDFSVYVALRMATTCLYCFSVTANIKMARALGTFWFTFFYKHRCRAIENLQAAYPEMGYAEHRRIAKESMQHLCTLGVEMLFTTRLVRQENWKQFVELGQFGDALKLLLRRNQGMLMLTGHYGNWEILGYVLATLGFETVSIFRPLDNPYVNHWVLGVRENRGQKMLAKKGAISEATELLEKGHRIGFIADQNAGSKGLFIDFFGRKASTYKSIALLAIEYKVPVVVGYSRRTPGKFHFTVGCQDIIYPHDWETRDDPVLYITQRYTSAIEAFVREVPEQYLWVHRRWKTRPKEEG